MSDTATERSWSGAGTDMRALAAQVAQISRAHLEDGRGSTRTLNLVVAPPGDAVEAAALDEALAGLGHRHPSRTIRLREHDSPQIDADVTIACTISRGADPGFCHDEIVLTADRERLEHADSLIAGLLIPGLPEVGWLPSRTSGPADAAIARLATVLVLDSGMAAELPGAVEALRRSASLIGRAPVRDLAWTTLHGWRGRVAAAFDDPDALSVLRAADELEVRASDAPAAQPLLLAAWIAVRAGWEPAAAFAPEADGCWATTAHKPGGDPVRIVLRSTPCDDGRTTGAVDELALHGDGRDVRLHRGPALPHHDALAATLRALDDPARGYREAVRWASR